jgi:hypothetical protein
MLRVTNTILNERPLPCAAVVAHKTSLSAMVRIRELVLRQQRGLCDRKKAKLNGGLSSF